MLVSEAVTGSAPSLVRTLLMQSLQLPGTKAGPDNVNVYCPELTNISLTPHQNVFWGKLSMITKWIMYSWIKTVIIPFNHSFYKKEQGKHLNKMSCKSQAPVEQQPLRNVQQEKINK